ncbi:MAG: hypothetical protein ACYCZR_02280 [Burkholderiales bacterium]
MYTVAEFKNDVAPVLPFAIKKQMIENGFSVDDENCPHELRRMIFLSIEKLGMLTDQGLPETADMSVIAGFLERGNEQIEYSNRDNVLATVNVINVAAKKA